MSEQTPAAEQNGDFVLAGYLRFVQSDKPGVMAEVISTHIADLADPSDVLVYRRQIKGVGTVTKRLAEAAGIESEATGEQVTAAEALDKARSWADGRHSYTNLGWDEPYTPDVIAVMDAQEVVKWSALAAALTIVEAMQSGSDAQVDR